MIVTVAAPAVALFAAVRVNTLDPIVEGGANDAVTPVGRPLVLNATLSLKLPVALTVIVLVLVLPC